MEKRTNKGKANIYCFYDIIPLFKNIQGARAQIFFNLMHTCYLKGGLRMLRPGYKIIVKKKCTLTFRYNVLIGNAASYVLCIHLIATSGRHT